MKYLTLTAVLVLFAVSAQAQTTTVGARYSNYNTDLELGAFGDLFSVDTGREHSLGLNGEFRSGMFLAGAQYDHDFAGGINAVDFIPVEVAEFTRDRFEGWIGLAPLPYLSVDAGFRLDKITVSGSEFFGDPLFDDVDVDHTAFFVGAKVQTATNRPIGAYGLVRGYFGSADTGAAGVTLSSDTSGFRVEGGVPIAVGKSAITVTPGIEFEHIETDDIGIDFDTNRVFVNVSYSF